MNKKLKIAIYSGEIPSTTFIERLIDGLSTKDCEILLFGRINKKSQYNSRKIKIKGYKSNKVYKGIYLLYYTTLLLIFKSKDKQKLDTLLKVEARNNMYERVKCYPVLWHKPDIFHIQWAKGLKDWIWVKDFGIKLVLSLRGAHINYSPIADKNLAEMYQKYFPKVDAFHAVSKAISNEALKYGAKDEKIKVVFSGLDLNNLTNPTLNASQKNNTFNVISVGRPHWIKGYVYALDAFKLLKEENFRFTYTIVGGLNLELKYQIKELGLEDHVLIVNYLPFDEVQRLIGISDLFLLPSLKEGIANVVLEAMAAKKVVLTTNCGGMEEVVVDGHNGFVVPIRDTNEMAKKIIEISKLSDVQKQKITSNAFATIQKQHSEELMIERMLELYKSL